MLGLCFVLQYVVSFLVLQPSHWGRESWLLYFCCVLKDMPLLSFFGSSWRCQGWSVVCDCVISWPYSLIFFGFI